MKKIILLISTILCSCSMNKEYIFITELNTVGWVIEKTDCKKCIDGGYIYKIMIDPDENVTMKYISDCKYKIGDTLYFKTNIQKND